MARFGYIQIIRRCNQRCLFCSNPDNDELLPLADAVALIDDFAARGMDGVLLSGGEPTLHPELPAIIRAARDAGIPPRVITNGQRSSDRAYVETLVDAGLDHVHVSIQSHRPEVQGRLSDKDDSLAHLEASLGNLTALGVTVDINTTLNSANADHLDETVAWLIERFPDLTHWVFNNLDPTSDRAMANPEVIASPQDFELALHRALRLLDQTERTFRVERVPLCYMTAFAYASTEARKLIKSESREILFLDERGYVDDSSLWKRYGKAPGCKVCTLNPICPGLFAPDVHDFRDQLYPVFVSREDIISRVREP